MWITLLVGVVYCIAMNTLVASWGGRLRARIGRLAEQVSAWSAAKGRQREEDMELKPEVKRELLAQVEDAKQGKNISPGFTDIKDMEKWLNSQS